MTQPATKFLFNITFVNRIGGKIEISEGNDPNKAWGDPACG